jgi:hypothetical protein
VKTNTSKTALWGLSGAVNNKHFGQIDIKKGARKEKVAKKKT